AQQPRTGGHRRRRICRTHSRPGPHRKSRIMRYSKRFRVKPGHKLKLAHIDPDFHSTHEDEAAAKGEIVTNLEKLRAIQYRMYAENKRSLLVCLLAMDRGAKSGIIQHVRRGIIPQGCRVQAFKTPSA